MSDTITTPVAPPAPVESASVPRGYFNRAELEHIDDADAILASARANATALAEQDVEPADITTLADAVTEARRRVTLAAGEAEDSIEATQEARDAARSLYHALQGIQSAAKQKHKKLAEDEDPDTNFPLTGYLIGTRLNLSRALLIQSAETLITRATEDDLPGFKTPEKIAAVQALLDAYRGAKTQQAEGRKSKELARLSRTELIHVLDTRAASLQHAADNRWPWHNDANRPLRKLFLLPLNRPLGV